MVGGCPAVPANPVADDVGIALTRWSIDRADHRQGRRNAFLRTRSTPPAWGSTRERAGARRRRPHGRARPDRTAARRPRRGRGGVWEMTPGTEQDTEVDRCRRPRRARHGRLRRRRGRRARTGRRRTPAGRERTTWTNHRDAAQGVRRRLTSLERRANVPDLRERVPEAGWWTCPGPERRHLAGAPRASPSAGRARRRRRDLGVPPAAGDRWLTQRTGDRAGVRRDLPGPLTGWPPPWWSRNGAVVGDLMLRIGDPDSQAEVADRARGSQAELGWVIDPAHAGRGLATEAVTELLRICFEDSSACGGCWPSASPTTWPRGG